MLLLLMVALAGCRSHRTTVKHEETRSQRVMQDSTVTRVDSTTRRDSVSLSWLAGELSLEVDSIDWHFTWDSAGRMAGVTGRRLVSRRSESSGQKSAATVLEESREEARYQRAIQDSIAIASVQDKHVETQAGWRPGWLEVACIVVLLVLAVGGVLHLRELTERWNRRR